MPLRWRHTIAGAGAGALCSLCLTLSAQAGSLGDGSGADNERLQANVFPTSPVLASGAAVAEPYDPFFDIDWSVGLRGSYTKSTSGERFDIRVVPQVGFEHIGSRSAISFDADAEIGRPSDSGAIDISALRLGLKSGYNLDSVTRLTANGSLSLTQAIAGSPGLASNVAIAPQTLSGGFDVGVTRQFGRFNVGLTGGAERKIYGATTLTDGSVTQNYDSNYWALDTGLRVGFAATPIFEVFAEAGLGRDIFDHPSVQPNATDATLMGGITGRWNDRLEATASAGLGLRRFDTAGLPDVVTQLYDAKVSFTPDSTWRMTAGFETKVAPAGPTGSGTTRVDYRTSAEVAYTVNSWLALRAMADWSTTSFAGSSATETGQSLGTGFDYKVNAHTALAADYRYGQTNSSADGQQDSHRATLGITLSR